MRGTVTDARVSGELGFASRPGGCGTAPVRFSATRATLP
jgi:hypothetical protein